MDLSDLIERNAAFTPDKAAIHFESTSLTYAAFDARIEQTDHAVRLTEANHTDVVSRDVQIRPVDEHRLRGL